MILVDTSAWVEYDRATGSATDRTLVGLIAEQAPLAVCDPVFMEVLAGARDERRADELRRMLTSFTWVPTEPAADFEGASRVYRVCRRAGVTPRGLLDCQIVSIALRSGSELLAVDDDFARIATVVPLRLHPTR